MLTHYDLIVRGIVRAQGGNREKAILAHSYEVVRGETWNSEHRILHVLATEADEFGHKDGFDVDLATRKICG